MLGHETQGKRVRVYIGERDKAEGQHDPLWDTLLHVLRDEGAAGATMFRGLAGFGAHSKIHVAHGTITVETAEIVRHSPHASQRPTN